MSGEYLPEVGEDVHRGTARAGRPSDPGSSHLHPSPPQVPLSGRKSLNPWGSYQVDFHGVGNDKETTRRRADVPTLGPLSYSLPVTPLGRDGGACSMWDGGAEDLAREAAEGWSVPPMPYGDVTVGRNGLVPQPQRKQQIGSRLEAHARRAGMLGGGVTGRNRSLRVHSHSPVGGCTDNIKIEYRHALAAERRGDVGRLAANEGSRDNNQLSGNLNGSNTNSNSDINSVPEEVVEEDREDPELAEEYTENGLRNAQLGEEASSEALEEEEDKARRHEEADGGAYDHREMMEDATLNVYFSPPQWQPSSTSGISKAIPVNAGDNVRGRAIQDEFQLESGRDSGDGGATLDWINAEGVLEKMVAVLRQAGVALDPSLESEISSVLARSATPLRQERMTLSPPLRGRAATLPTTTPPPHAALASADTSPVQPVSASAATSAETLAAPAPVRAFASCNGSTIEGEVEGSGGAGDVASQKGTPRPVREQSRERAWTVPSPYHAFDETFMSPRGPYGRRVAEFRLDDAAIGGGNNSKIAIISGDNGSGNVMNMSSPSALGTTVLTAVGGVRGGGGTWRECSCGGAGGRAGGAGRGNSRAAIAAGALATREDVIRAWKACISCGAGPGVVGGGPGARGAGVKDSRRVETVMSMTASPTRVTVNAADVAAEQLTVTAEESSAFAEATRAADVDVGSVVASAEFATALENGRGRMDTVGQSSCRNDTGSRYSVGGGGGGVRGRATADDSGVGERGKKMMTSETVARGRGDLSAGGGESRSGGFYGERSDGDDPDLRRVDDGMAEDEGDGWGEDGNGGVDHRGMKRDSSSPTPPAPHQAVVMQKQADARDNVAAMTTVDTGRKANGLQLPGGEARGENSGDDRSTYRDEDADLDEWDDDLDPGYMVMALSEDEFLRGDSHRLTPHAVLHSSPHPRKEFGVNAYEDNKCDDSNALERDEVSVDGHDDHDDRNATNTSRTMLKSGQSAQLPLPPPRLLATEVTGAFAGDFAGAVTPGHGSSDCGRDNALDVIGSGDFAPVVRDGGARRNSDRLGCSARGTWADTGGRTVSELIGVREEKPRRRHTVGGCEGADEAAMVGALSVKPVIDDGDRRGDVPGRERAYLPGDLDDGHHRGWEYHARRPADGGGDGGHGSRDGNLLETSLRRESFGGGEDSYGHGQQYEQDLEQAVALLDGTFALDAVERGDGAAGVGNVGSGSWVHQHGISGGGGGGGDSLNSSGAGGGASNNVSEQNGPGLSDGGHNGMTDSRNGDRVRKGRFHDGSIGTGVHGAASHGPDDGHGRRVETGRLDDQLTNGGGCWSNVRARRVGGGIGHEVGRSGVMMELYGGRGSSGDGGDGTGGSRGSRRKHSFACSEMSAGSGGGNSAAGSRGGHTPAGSFDSSAWPRTASEFAFSQDLGDSQAFLGHRDRGLVAGQSGTLGANRHGLRVSLDRAFQETGPQASPHDHPAQGNSGVKSSGFRGGGGGVWEDGETVTASTSQHEEHVSCNSRSSSTANAKYPNNMLMRLSHDGMQKDHHPRLDLTSALLYPATEGSRGDSLEERCRSQQQGEQSGPDFGKWPGDDKGSRDENNNQGLATGQEVHLTRGGHVATAQRGGDSRGFGGSRSGSSPSPRTGVSANAGSSPNVSVDGVGHEATRDVLPESMTAGVGCDGDDEGLGICGGIGGHDEDFEEEELESFNLRVVYAKGRTGFQESKAFDWPEGSLVAGRYEVCGYIGTAAFSTALHCRDLRRRRGEDSVCLKVIKNNKDFFDQSLDEIKLLQRLKERGNPDEHHVLHMLDFFYFEEHLVIVSELLGENLYEFAKAVKEAGHPPYFTLPRLCKVMRQCLQALSYVNSLGMLHCDVKPENILLSNYGKAEVKLIDFGSSCFLTDRLTTYTQSRSYRAPEVVLGLPYGAKVDMWSLGAVVAELVTGHVLLQSDSIQTMLARIQGIMGPFPDWMLREGEEAPKYFTPEGCVYQRMEDDSDMESSEAGDDPRRSPPPMAGAVRYAILHPKRTCLRRRLRVKDAAFLDFASKLLCVDPTLRPEAKDALEHPWILSGLSYSEEDLWYPPNKKDASHGEDEDNDEDEEQVEDVLIRGSDGGGGTSAGRAVSSLSSRRRQSS